MTRQRRYSAWDVEPALLEPLAMMAVEIEDTNPIRPITDYLCFCRRRRGGIDYEHTVIVRKKQRGIDGRDTYWGTFGLHRPGTGGGGFDPIRHCPRSRCRQLRGRPPRCRSKPRGVAANEIYMVLRTRRNPGRSGAIVSHRGPGRADSSRLDPEDWRQQSQPLR